MFTSQNNGLRFAAYIDIQTAHHLIALDLADVVFTMYPTIWDEESRTDVVFANESAMNAIQQFLPNHTQIEGSLVLSFDQDGDPIWEILPANEGWSFVDFRQQHSHLNSIILK